MVQVRTLQQRKRLGNSLVNHIIRPIAKVSFCCFDLFLLFFVFSLIFQNSLRIGLLLSFWLTTSFFSLYLRSACFGFARAMYNTGWSYRLAKDVPKNLAKGFEWNLKAAEQGDAEGKSS